MFQGFDFTPPQVTQIIRSAFNKNWSFSEEDPTKELKEPEIDFE